jgi:hypothetical protein
MADELDELRARLAARMRQLNIAPDDPRIGPLFAVMKRLMRDHVIAEDRVHSPEPRSPELANEASCVDAVPRFRPKSDAWGKAVEAKLTTLAPDVAARLTPLLVLASQGGDKAKPAMGWLKATEKTLASAPCEPALLVDLIECHEPGAQIFLENQNTLRALLWLAAMAAPAAARRLEAYAQKCLTFSSAHFAYLSLVLGNAAIHAFTLVPGTLGVGSLSRLKRRLKRPGEIKTVDKASAALAAARGMTASELEEIGLPDYGFAADGTMEVAVGPARAVLMISDAHALETQWRGADGRELSGPPAAVKEAHVAELKALRAQVKEMGETLAAQRLRLERLYLVQTANGRSISGVPDILTSRWCAISQDGSSGRFDWANDGSRLSRSKAACAMRRGERLPSTARRPAFGSGIPCTPRWPKCWLGDSGSHSSALLSRSSRSIARSMYLPTLNDRPKPARTGSHIISSDSISSARCVRHAAGTVRLTVTTAQTDRGARAASGVLGRSGRVVDAERDVSIPVSHHCGNPVRHHKKRADRA